MFKLNLVLRRKSDDLMIFSPAPWFRILFLAIAAFFIVGIITVSADEGESSSFIFPVIITAVCVIAALYEESWRFDRGSRTITAKTGLMIIHSTKVIAFDDVESLELFFFLRGAESDGEADHEINLTKPFSKENTAEASGTGPKIIHKKYHQEIRLNLKSGELKTIESLDSRTTEALTKKASVLSEFSGIKLVK